MVYSYGNYVQLTNPQSDYLQILFLESCKQKKIPTIS